MDAGAKNAMGRKAEIAVQVLQGPRAEMPEQGRREAVVNRVAKDAGPLGADDRVPDRLVVGAAQPIDGEPEELLDLPKQLPFSPHLELEAGAEAGPELLGDRWPAGLMGEVGEDDQLLAPAVEIGGVFVAPGDGSGPLRHSPT